MPRPLGVAEKPALPDARPEPAEHHAGPDWPFWALVALICGFYALIIIGMLLADTRYAAPSDLLRALNKPEIRFSIGLSLITCTLAALFSLLVAIPAGYLLSRARFPARGFLDVLLDTPIILPPLVIGISLLILFQTPICKLIEEHVEFTYTVAGVVLAQFMVACAFAVRTMRATFDHLPARPEQVALTLGCTRAQAFRYVALPACRRGAITAFSMAWARAMGEFGPVLVFAGATRFKTEVLPTTVFLELSVGNLEAAVAVSLLMVVTAFAVLSVIRLFGEKEGA